MGILNDDMKRVVRQQRMGYRYRLPRRDAEPLAQGGRRRCGTTTTWYSPIWPRRRR